MNALEAIEIIEPMALRLREMRDAANESCKSCLRVAAEDLEACVNKLKSKSFDETRELLAKALKGEC